MRNPALIPQKECQRLDCPVIIHFVHIPFRERGVYARTGFPVPVFLCCIFNYLRIQYDTDLLFADDLPGFVIIRVICIFSRGGYFICNIWCVLFTGMAFMARLSARLLPCFFTAVGDFFLSRFLF